MKQVGALAVGLWLSMMGSLGWALDLGPAEVQSRLEEPLQATLPLVDSAEYSPSDLEISVSDQRAFEDAGVEWTALAGRVQVNIQERQDQPVVVLTSDEPVTSPWLDLLLTVSSPDGQQTREMTLLFDPPDYGARDEPAERAPAQPIAEDDASAEPPSREAAQGDAYVRSGDTLWSVAARTKPEQASVQQMMLALLEANPSVFPSGNIHAMRAAQRLNLPEDDRVTAHSAEQAATTIREMNTAWQRRDENGPVPVALPEVDGTNDSESSAEVQEDEPAEPESVSTNQAVASAPLTGQNDGQSIEPAVVSAVNVLANGEQESASQRAPLPSVEPALALQWQQERDDMRREIATLREEVARLSETVASQQMVTASPAPATERRSIMERLSEYQWWLAIIALILLLALLVIMRRRRQHWEAPPAMAAPGTNQPHTPSASNVSPRRDPSMVSPTPPPQADATMAAEPVSKTSTDEAVSRPTASNIDETYPAYEVPFDRTAMANTQAAGLIEIGQEHRLALKALPAGHNPALWLAPPADPLTVATMLSAMGGRPLEETLAAAPGEAQVPADNERAWVIDYQPPTLTSSNAPREETPMQPSVEFDAQAPAPTPSPAAREEEWDIEEVAFAPTPRDNSSPSTPGNVDKRR